MFWRLLMVLALLSCGRTEVVGGLEPFPDAGSTITPALEADLLTRWNAAAAQVDTRPLSFQWVDIADFPHPTYRGGDTRAYTAFVNVLLRFYDTGDNVDFLRRNGLLDEPLRYGPVGSVETLTFIGLTHELSTFSLVPADQQALLAAQCRALGC